MELYLDVCVYIYIYVCTHSLLCTLYLTHSQQCLMQRPERLEQPAMGRGVLPTMPQQSPQDSKAKAEVVRRLLHELWEGGTMKNLISVGAWELLDLEVQGFGFGFGFRITLRGC